MSDLPSQHGLFGAQLSALFCDIFPCADDSLCGAHPSCHFLLPKEKPAMLAVSIWPPVRLWKAAYCRVRKVQGQEGGRLTPQRCRHSGDGWMPACCLAHMTGNTSPSSSSPFYCHLSGRILARQASHPAVGVACYSGLIMRRSGPSMLSADAQVVHSVCVTVAAVDGNQYPHAR